MDEQSLIDLQRKTHDKIIAFLEVMKANINETADNIDKNVSTDDSATGMLELKRKLQEHLHVIEEIKATLNVEEEQAQEEQVRQVETQQLKRATVILSKILEDLDVFKEALTDLLHIEELERKIVDVEAKTLEKLGKIKHRLFDVNKKSTREEIVQSQTEKLKEIKKELLEELENLSSDDIRESAGRRKYARKIVEDLNEFKNDIQTLFTEMQYLKQNIEAHDGMSEFGNNIRNYMRQTHRLADNLTVNVRTIIDKEKFFDSFYSDIRQKIIVIRAKAKNTYESEPDPEKVIVILEKHIKDTLAKIHELISAYRTKDINRTMTARQLCTDLKHMVENDITQMMQLISQLRTQLLEETRRIDHDNSNT